jgi:hypothetical protein
MKTIVSVVAAILVVGAAGTYYAATQRPGTCSTLNSRFVWGGLSEEDMRRESFECFAPPMLRIKMWVFGMPPPGE